MKKYAIISHDDFDGFAPTFLAKAAFGEQLIFAKNCNYGEVNQVAMDFINSNEYTEDVVLFITDLGLKDETMEAVNQFVEVGREVHMFDHHKQNEPLNRFSWANIIVEKNGIKTAGTTLFYEYLVDNGWLFPNAFLNSFVEIVRSYDTWDWTINNDILAKEFNRLLYLIGPKRMENYFFKNFNGDVSLTESPITEIPEEYTLAMDIDWEGIQEYVKDSIKRVRFVEYKGYKVAVSFTEFHLPHVVDGITNNFEDVDFVCVLNVGANKGSFRSRKPNITVDWIAKELGGGGHPMAAGFEPSNDMLATIISNVDKGKFL